MIVLGNCPFFSVISPSYEGSCVMRSSNCSKDQKNLETIIRYWIYSFLGPVQRGTSLRGGRKQACRNCPQYGDFGRRIRGHPPSNHSALGCMACSAVDIVDVILELLSFSFLLRIFASARRFLLQGLFALGTLFRRSLPLALGLGFRRSLRFSLSNLMTWDLSLLLLG